MKNKTHISNWAIALCAIALFSVTGTAYGLVVAPLPAPILQPGPDVPAKPQPLPPLTSPILIGDSTGTVMVD